MNTFRVRDFIAHEYTAGARFIDVVDRDPAVALIAAHFIAQRF
jgi:hypothetical protein